METTPLVRSDSSKHNDPETKNEAEADPSPAPDQPPEVHHGSNAEVEKKEGEEAASAVVATAVEENEGEESEESAKETPAEDVVDDAHYDLNNAMEDVDKFLSSLHTDHDDMNHVSLENHKFIDILLNLLEVKIINYNIESSEGKSRWGQDPDEDTSFLEAVSRVSKLSAILDKHKRGENFGPVSNRVGSIHQRAMTILEDEFRLLVDCLLPANPNSSEENKSAPQENDQPEDAVPDILANTFVISNLNKIAKAMISGDYETECCQVYMLSRKHLFDDMLNNVGFDGVSIDDVQKMSWETLEREIIKWIELFKQCATVHFPNGLKLIEAVFTDFPTISRYLFCNLTRSVMIHILNFAEAVAMSKRAAEKLFKFLDMYEALRDSGHAIEGLFNEDHGQEVKTEIVTARSRLGESVVSIFCDLENSIMSDMGKNVVPGGAVHPLTRYTMNYLKYASEYKDTLEQVFKEHLKIERADSNNRPEFDSGNPGYSNDVDQNKSQFSLQLMKVMDLLDSNLEAKSKLYKDVSLSSIFMMNNGRYILQKVKGSTEINQLLGDNWRRKKSSELRQYHKNYQRETWNKVLGCLRDDHGLTVHGKVVKPELKERFKNFNAMFDEIHKTQSTWVVSDEQLQSELRVSISAVVIPAYRSFLGRFSQYMAPGRQTEKYIKYQAEDLETYIDELFDGNAANSTKKRT